MLQFQGAQKNYISKLKNELDTAFMLNESK